MSNLLFFILVSLGMVSYIAYVIFCEKKKQQAMLVEKKRQLEFKEGFSSAESCIEKPKEYFTLRCVIEQREVAIEDIFSMANEMGMTSILGVTTLKAFLNKADEPGFQSLLSIILNSYSSKYGIDHEIENVSVLGGERYE